MGTPWNFSVPITLYRNHTTHELLATENVLWHHYDVGWLESVRQGRDISLSSTIKSKFHYASWFEAGRRQVRNHIPLRYLVPSCFEAGRRQLRSWSATSFEHVCDQLRTS